MTHHPEREDVLLSNECLQQKEMFKEILALLFLTRLAVIDIQCYRVQAILEEWTDFEFENLVMLEYKSNLNKLRITNCLLTKSKGM